MQTKNYLEKWILNERPERPFLVAVSGAQGCGKSTFCRDLVESYTGLGLRAISVSVDDFYLTRDQQKQLTESTSNPYLMQRGYPGTHDVPLALKILKTLKAGLPTQIPRYDKSAYSGLGDRGDRSTWTEVREPQDIILFEGWFLGFQPTQTEDNHLNLINEHLSNYQPLFDLFDRLVYLRPESVEDVVDWRIEAEQKMKAAGKDGMSDEQVRSYIEKFVPAYHLYGPSIQPSIEFLVQTDRSWLMKA